MLDDQVQDVVENHGDDVAPERRSCGRRRAPSTNTNPGFNKAKFAKLIAVRFGVSQDDGRLLWNEISQRIESALEGGDTAFLFGVGTLKVVKSKGALGAPRVRFRPTTAKAKVGVTAQFYGLPGMAGDAVDAVAVRSISSAYRALHAGRACVLVKSDTCLVIYSDRAAVTHCVAIAPDGQHAEFVPPTKEAAKAWLKEQAGA